MAIFLLLEQLSLVSVAAPQINAGDIDATGDVSAATINTTGNVTVGGNLIVMEPQRLLIQQMFQQLIKISQLIKAVTMPHLRAQDLLLTELEQMVH